MNKPTVACVKKKPDVSVVGDLERLDGGGGGERRARGGGALLVL